MGFSDTDIADQLTRIEKSRPFLSSPKLLQFLRYVVKETVEGRSDQIKQYTIATSALGLESDFDPLTSPAIRVMARRLRRALEEYYLDGGAADPIRISIPKGSYSPDFVENSGNMPINDAAAVEPSANPGQSTNPVLPSLAILPIQSLGLEAEYAFLATGLCEEISIAFARFPELRIVGPLDATLSEEAGFSASAIGRDFNVRFVLSGTARLRLDTLRISIRLSDTEDDRQVWIRSFDFDLPTLSIEQLEEEVVSRTVSEIADNFGVIPRTLSSDIFGERRTTSATYEAILRFHHHNRTLSEGSLEQAATALQYAIEQDPTSDLALGMLADMIGAPYFMGFEDDASCLDEATKLARQALAHNPNSQEAYFALAQVHYSRQERAACLDAVNRTIEINPYNANYLAITSVFLMGLGEVDRSKAGMETAMRLNPHHPGWYHMVPFLDHYYRGDFEVAFEHVVAFNTPAYFWDPLVRAAVLGQLDRADAAREAASELLSLRPDFGSVGLSVIRRMVFEDENVDCIADGLRKAGLTLR